VSQQLNDQIFRRGSTRRSPLDVKGDVEGALKRFVSIYIQPNGKWHLVQVAKTGGSDAGEQLGAMAQQCAEAHRVVALGRLKQTDHWHVKFCGAPDVNSSCESMASGDVDYWRFVWGRRSTYDRQVVTIFHMKWMIYDQYGSLSSNMGTQSVLQPCEPSLVPAAGAVSDSPVTNTVYKGYPDGLEKG